MKVHTPFHNMILVVGAQFLRCHHTFQIAKDNGIAQFEGYTTHKFIAMDPHVKSSDSPVSILGINIHSYYIHLYRVLYIINRVLQ